MAADPLDALLEAATDTGAVVAVPGLLNWLGRDRTDMDPGFKASIDGRFTESFEDYCDRISRKEAS
jgi:hypothetical protein